MWMLPLYLHVNQKSDYDIIMMIYDRFYVAMLPCPTVMLSVKHEFKIFQHYQYFSSDSATAGL